MAEPQDPGPETQPEPERTGEPDPTQLSALLQELARAPAPSPSEPERPSLRPGDVVGKFTIVRPIGRGGFGVVLEAVDGELGRRVAFKALRPRRALQGQGAEWLRREAEAVARLQHPAIVTLHDYGRGPTGPYLIFELLRGETLQERLRAGPLPLREAVHVARAVAEALAHAHASGVIHRDMKPSNIFLCRSGAVKVLDFGLARLFERADAQSGGTPAYMAPEQWRREPEDERTDLFCLGATLHETLCGSPPYRATKSHGEVLEEGPTPRLPDRRLPLRLRRLVSRMLERDPARRPQGAAEVAAELAAVEASLARRRARLALAATFGLAVLAIALLLLRGAPAGQTTVAVADVVNETGERDLDGLSTLLGTSLERSPRLLVLPRSDLAEIAAGGAEPPERIGEAAGLAAARAAGAGALLVPVIRGGAAGYTLRLRAVEPSGGAELFALEESAAERSGIAPAAERLAAAARVRLRDRGAVLERMRRREADTPALLQAYGLYYEAERAFGSGTESENSSDWAEARALLERAVQLDPGFASAHFRIASAYWFERRRPEAVAAVARAQANRDRATPREQVLIGALDAYIAGRIPEAVAAYEKAIAAWPGDRQAYFDLSRLHASREGGRDLARAVEAARRGVEVAPRSGAMWEQLLDCEKAMGRWDLVAGDARGYARAVPSVPAFDWLGMALLNLGRRAEAEEAFRQEAQVLGPHGLGGLALSAVLARDWERAEGHFRQLAAAEALPAAREGHYGLSAVSAHRGRYREAAQRLEPVVAQDRASGERADEARALALQALWLTLSTGRFAAGPVDRGLALLREIREPPLVQRHFYWFAELAALRAGEPDRAEALEAEAARLGSTHLASLLRMSRARAAGRTEDWRREAAAVRDPGDLTYGFHLPVAEWELEAGRLDEALAAVDRALALPVWPHPDILAARAVSWPRALLVRARIQLARGEADAARADLAVLLEAWKEADPAAPDVVAARALWRELARGRAAAVRAVPRR